MGMFEKLEKLLREHIEVEARMLEIDQRRHQLESDEPQKVFRSDGEVISHRLHVRGVEKELEKLRDKSIELYKRRMEIQEKMYDETDGLSGVYILNIDGREHRLTSVYDREHSRLVPEKIPSVSVEEQGFRGYCQKVRR